MSKKQFIINSFVGLGVGLINGFFGAGGGLLCVLALKRFSKLETKSAHATAIAVILPLSVISVIMYSLFSDVSILTALPYIVGGLAGAPIGSLLLKSIPANIIKKIFAITLILISVKMLLS